MLSESDRYEKKLDEMTEALFGESRTPSARQVSRALNIHKSSLLRLLADPRRGFPRPFRLDPTSERSVLHFFAREIAAWCLAQQAQTAALKEEAVPLAIHLARGARA